MSIFFWIVWQFTTYQTYIDTVYIYIYIHSCSLQFAVCSLLFVGWLLVGCSLLFIVYCLLFCWSLLLFLLFVVEPSIYWPGFSICRSMTWPMPWDMLPDLDWKNHHLGIFGSFCDRLISGDFCFFVLKDLSDHFVQLLNLLTCDNFWLGGFENPKTGGRFSADNLGGVRSKFCWVQLRHFWISNSQSISCSCSGSFQNWLMD